MTYTVASAGAAPASLTYGPSFFSLAADYGGKVVIGLNRRLNDQANTIAAAKAAKAAMRNLYSIELGNEPNCKCLTDASVSVLLTGFFHQSLPAVTPSPEERLGTRLPITLLNSVGRRRWAVLSAVQTSSQLVYTLELRR